MKKIASLFLACIATIASDETVVVSQVDVTPPSYTETVAIRPRRIVIEYPDDTAADPTVSAIYEKLTIRKASTNAPVIASRETVRMVSLQWNESTNRVPSLAPARVEFAAVFKALFPTNSP